MQPIVFQQVHRRRAQEGSDESVGRLLVDLLGRAYLAYYALMQHHHAVAHGHGFDLVVSHVDGGGANAFLEILDLLAGGGAQLGVEIRERFIQQEHGRIAHHGAGQSYALAFAAGQLARLALQQVADAKQPSRPLYLLLVLLLAGPSVPSAETTILSYTFRCG